MEKYGQMAMEVTKYEGALRKLRSIMRASNAHSAWIEKQCGVTGAQLGVLGAKTGNSPVHRQQSD